MSGLKLKYIAHSQLQFYICLTQRILPSKIHKLYFYNFSIPDALKKYLFIYSNQYVVLLPVIWYMNLLFLKSTMGTGTVSV